MPERSFHLSNGILIGAGIVAIIVGFVGWFIANYLFGALSPIFQEFGIDPNQHYIFTRLGEIEYSNIFLVAGGVISLFAGLINDYLPRKKRTV
jgi:hypothetical protein